MTHFENSIPCIYHVAQSFDDAHSAPATSSVRSTFFLTIAALSSNLSFNLRILVVVRPEFVPGCLADFVALDQILNLGRF
jgi:hypothetical protein